MAPSMNVDDLVAIDVHTHAEVSSKGHSSLDDDLHDASSAYFKVEGKRKPTLEETAAYYRERKMAAVIFTVDAESATGTAPVPNEEVAEAAAANSDVLIPFASIDPFRGKAGAKQARRLVEEYGVKGFKFHPSIQGFFPNDRSVAYDLYEVIEETGTIALFHTGQTGIGAGVPGGGGIRLKYSNPSTWTTWPPTSRTSRSSWRTRPSPGRTRPSPSPRTSRACTSTCPAGHRSTSRRSSCSTPTPC